MKTSLMTTGLPIDFAAPRLQPQARGDAMGTFADDLRSAGEGFVAPPAPAPAPAPSASPAPAPSPAQQRAERRDERSDTRRDGRDDRRDEDRREAQGVERRDARRDVRRDERDDRRDARRAERRDRRAEHAKEHAKEPAGDTVAAGATRDGLLQAAQDAQAAEPVDPRASTLTDAARSQAAAALLEAGADARAAAVDPKEALAEDALRQRMAAASSTTDASVIAAAAKAPIDRVDIAGLGEEGAKLAGHARSARGAHAGAAARELVASIDAARDGAASLDDVHVAPSPADAAAQAPRPAGRGARGARGDGDAARATEADAAPDKNRGADRTGVAADLPAALWRDTLPIAGGLGAGVHAASAASGTATAQASAIGAIHATASGAVASAAASAAAVPEHTIGAAPGTPDFARALTSQVTLWAREGTQEARLQLNPADLGPVTVMIAIDGAQARVDFQAHAAATRDAIEASLPSLASALNEQGLTLSGGGVFDRPNRDASAQAQQAQGGAGKGRGDGAGDDDDADAIARAAAASAARFGSVRGLVDLVA
jgi:flagellar hook-length control protein FliK